MDRRDANVELAEECIDGADLVKPHLVDQLFEDDWIFSEEVYTPFPIVHADGAGDDLFDYICRSGGRSFRARASCVGDR